jgi:hypothetical protein
MSGLSMPIPNAFVATITETSPVMLDERARRSLVIVGIAPIAYIVGGNEE